ncbi:unnamed protein product, partial [Effrenium voratum]
MLLTLLPASYVFWASNIEVRRTFRACSTRWPCNCLSEIFEYALRCGNADSLCPTIQPFKLAHAMLLADMGLTDKARRYMVLLQAFVKAVPQNRLSDAFRSSMREFNE